MDGALKGRREKIARHELLGETEALLGYLGGEVFSEGFSGTASEIFSSRLCAAMTLSRMLSEKKQDVSADISAAGKILKMLSAARNTPEKLLLLDVLCSFNPPGLSTALSGFLAPGDTVFLRGLLWVMGASGRDDSPGCLAAFLKNPLSACVKDELLAEAFWLSVRGDVSRLNALALKDEDFRRFAAHRRWPRRDPAYRYFGVYPYADYLWAQAKRSGMSKKDFRLALYRPRTKNSGYPPPDKARLPESVFEG